MTDYLGDIKNTQVLIERIKKFYVKNGIPTINMKFWVEKSMDQWGVRVYSIRSNLQFDCSKKVLKLGK